MMGFGYYTFRFTILQEILLEKNCREYKVDEYFLHMEYWRDNVIFKIFQIY